VSLCLCVENPRALSLQVDEICDEGCGEGYERESAQEEFREHSFGFEVARATWASARVRGNQLAAVAAWFELQLIHLLGKALGTHVLIYQRASRVKYFPRI